MELHNLEPKIVEIHQFVDDQFIQKLSHVAMPLMSNADIQNAQFFSDERTSNIVWLPTSGADVISFLNKRIQLATGLATNSLHEDDVWSETAQVAAYSFGGHLEPCVDCEPVRKAIR